MLFFYYQDQYCTLGGVKTKNHKDILVRLITITSENYNQENFISKEMQQQVDYPEYVRSIEQEINYAEEKIDE